MIALSGLDGAGKSTQIDVLVKFFESKGKKVEVFWSRGGYTPGMEWLKRRLRKSNKSLIPSKQGNTKERDIAFSKASVRRLWLSLAIFDLILYYGFILRFKKWMGKTIISDRYLFDTLIDFQSNFPKEKVDSWILWKLLKIMAMKPKHHFVLTVPVEESLRRSKLKNEPFPDSKKVLEYRLKKYLDYCTRNPKVHHIDGNKPVDEVEREIMSYFKA
ncbi:hypothetical protein ACFLT1_00055 [Bacteroidota bacterium]